MEVEDEVDMEESTVKMSRNGKRMTLDYLCLMLLLHLPVLRTHSYLIFLIYVSWHSLSVIYN